MYSEPSILPEWVLLTGHIILSVAMLLTGWRILRGPTILDRVVGLDLLAALIMGHLIFFTLSSGFLSYLDVATAIAIIAFLATVALARYIENKETSL